VNLTFTNEDAGYPHLKKYLPEIFDGKVIEKMASNPWLDVHLLGRAIAKKIVPSTLEFSPRWSHEWKKYADEMSLGGPRPEVQL
jgi:hypothetical protein